MRRYLFSETRRFEAQPFDAVVVGSGIAGLYAALHLDPAMKVAVVTKTGLDGSSSWQAQGGIAAVLTDEDRFQLHMEDTLRAGAGLCDEEAVKVLVEEGPRDIRQLEEWEVPFDYDESGRLILGREGGHRLRRIAHCDGDATGRETTRRLGQLLSAAGFVTPFFRHYLADVVTDEKGVCGVLLYDEEKRTWRALATRHVILATGGVGQVYAHTTNPRGAVGDGMACAFRAGGRAKNMEMVQFHPTTLMAGEVDDRLFLISEAVRGEGAVLRNGRGEAFMQGKHPMADLAPRDIVTRCILKELRRTGEDRAYLDCSHMTRDFFYHRFPNISARCEKEGIELTRDFIPIHPAQHYFMGGVETSLTGETAVPGLYCCGEVSCTGVHGANRLASNSMLECLVFGRRCAETVKGAGASSVPETLAVAGDGRLLSLSPEERRQDRKELRKTLSHAFGPVRHTGEMQYGLAKLSSLADKYDHVACADPATMELCNMTTVALGIAKAACARKDSVGAHYVED